MTYRTCVSSRGQVAAMLMLGVYLTVASRSHFNQMVVDATGADDCHAYSALNVVYQVTYAAVQIPACAYADRLDAAAVLGAVLLGMAFSSMVAPFALPRLTSAPLSAAGLVVGALSAVNGALAGSWWPFMNAMLSNWAPPAELAYTYAAINTGVPGGVALGNAFTGFVYGAHNTVAFRYSFFLVSVVCALWSAVWLSGFRSRPESDPGVRQTELEYLNTSIRPKTKSSVPWRKMATSLPVWSVLIANYGSTVFYTVLVMYMPVYLKNTMRIDISQNGLMSALPSLCQMVVMYLLGCCASFVQMRRYTNVTNIRKVFKRKLVFIEIVKPFCKSSSLYTYIFSSKTNSVFTFVGMLVPACILMIAPISTDHYVFYSMLVLAYAISGSVFSGFRVSQMELAPNFVAAITAIGDLVGSFAMNFTHVAFIVSFGEISEQITWNQICWYLSTMLVICAGPFIFLGSSEVQSWNEVVSVTTNNEPGENVV